MERLSVSQAAATLHVSVKTLQRWDRTGVLRARRTLTNRRYYTEADLTAAAEPPTEVKHGGRRSHVTIPPDLERRIVEMHYQGVPVAEIATRVERPHGTIRTVLYRNNITMRQGTVKSVALMQRGDKRRALAVTDIPLAVAQTIRCEIYFTPALFPLTVYFRPDPYVSVLDLTAILKCPVADVPCAGVIRILHEPYIPVSEALEQVFSTHHPAFGAWWRDTLSPRIAMQDSALLDWMRAERTLNGLLDTTRATLARRVAKLLDVSVATCEAALTNYFGGVPSTPDNKDQDFHIVRTAQRLAGRLR